MKKPKRVIVIDLVACAFREEDVFDLSDMQKIVGGRIERAFCLENGDEIYVNEEGLFDRDAGVFLVKGAHQPFVGSAFVIGGPTKSGNSTSAKSSLKDIEKTVILWQKTRQGGPQND